MCAARSPDAAIRAVVPVLAERFEILKCERGCVSRHEFLDALQPGEAALADFIVGPQEFFVKVMVCVAQDSVISTSYPKLTPGSYFYSCDFGSIPDYVKNGMGAGEYILVFEHGIHAVKRYEDMLAESLSAFIPFLARHAPGARAEYAESPVIDPSRDAAPLVCISVVEAEEAVPLAGDDAQFAMLTRLLVPVFGDESSAIFGSCPCRTPERAGCKIGYMSEEEEKGIKHYRQDSSIHSCPQRLARLLII